jgi:hypothetical protein
VDATWNVSDPEAAGIDVVMMGDVQALAGVSVDAEITDDAFSVVSSEVGYDGFILADSVNPGVTEGAITTSVTLPLGWSSDAFRFQVFLVDENTDAAATGIIDISCPTGSPLVAVYPDFPLLGLRADPLLDDLAGSDNPASVLIVRSFAAPEEYEIDCDVGAAVADSVDGTFGDVTVDDIANPGPFPGSALGIEGEGVDWVVIASDGSLDGDPRTVTHDVVCGLVP